MVAHVISALLFSTLFGVVSVLSWRSGRPSSAAFQRCRANASVFISSTDDGLQPYVAEYALESTGVWRRVGDSRAQCVATNADGWTLGECDGGAEIARTRAVFDADGEARRLPSRGIWRRNETILNATRLDCMPHPRLARISRDACRPPSSRCVASFYAEHAVGHECLFDCGEGYVATGSAR